MKAQCLLVESRHRIASSQTRVFDSLLRLSWQRRIAGGNDAGLDGGCGHRVSWIEARLPYAEARAERDRFAAEFSDRFVSPVERAPNGFWGWRFCPQCPASLD